MVRTVVEIVPMVLTVAMVKFAEYEILDIFLYLHEVVVGVDQTSEKASVLSSIYNRAFPYGRRLQGSDNSLDHRFSQTLYRVQSSQGDGLLPHRTHLSASIE